MPHNTRKRVAPADLNGEILEIRPSRLLRIQHVNKRPRDTAFAKEMDMYMQYKKKGIVSGPLAMPRRQARNTFSRTEPNTSEDQSHPLSVIENRKSLITQDDERKANPHVSGCVKKFPVLQETASLNVSPSLSSEKSIIASNPCSNAGSLPSSCEHTSKSAKARSVSSVQLAMNSQQQQHLEESRLERVKKNMASDPAEVGQENVNKLNINLPPTKENKSTEHGDISSTKSSSLVDPTSVNPNPSESSQSTKLFSKVDHNSVDSSDNPADVEKSVQFGKDMVLFFIHGVGGSSDIWCGQIEFFASQGYEIIAPDLIGHGFSCTPKSPKAYHFKEIVADMEEMFDMFCKKRNVVIGHSYGASFATVLARNRPRHVTKLVLISGGPPTPLAPQPGVFSLPVCFLNCIKPCLICGFHKGAFHKKRKPIIAKEEAFNIPTNVLQHTMNGQDWPDGDEIYHNWLTCPCLLIYGAQDRLVGLEEEQDMAEAIFDSRLEVIDDASHMVMIEAPSEVNQLLETFLTQIVDPTSPSTQNNNAVSSRSTQMQSRSKSRMSLKSAKSQRSLPHHLLSKSLKA